MKFKVLLVDDNPTFVNAVRKFLELMPGVAVVGHAFDGSDALLKAETLMPDLVLLDIAMPRMNGLEVAQHMTTWPKPPQIVFLSMHDNAEYRLAAQGLGAAYVGKCDFVDKLVPLIAQLRLRGISPSQVGSTP